MNDNGRCSCQPYSQDVASCDFAFSSKLDAEWKGKPLNDLGELRLESSKILSFYPLEWFDQVYRQWIERL